MRLAASVVVLNTLILACGCGSQAVGDGSETSSQDDPCGPGEVLVLEVTDVCGSYCAPLPTSCGDAASCDPACQWDLCKTVDCVGEVSRDCDSPGSDPVFGWVCVQGFGSCNPWLGECPDDEQCVPYAPSPTADGWTSARCAPPQTDNIGEPCTRLGAVFEGLDTCEGGAVCWDVDPDSKLGLCIPLCSGAPHDPICPSGSQCVLADPMWAGFCLPPCDPQASDCTTGYACTQVGDALACMPA
ncbi:MAG TPA: hypothetical protein VK034_12525 [Enhygromyxa sp.]|nr:hypothetical protein [Enhygromyxa sp.]